MTTETDVAGRTRAARPSEPGAIAGLVMAMLLFGGAFIALRQGALAGLGSADLATLRYAAPGLLFLPIVVKDWTFGSGGIGWRRALALAACAGAPYGFLLMVGLHFAPALHGAVLNPGLTSVASALLGAVMLGDRLPRAAFLGIPITLAGLVLVAGMESLSIGPSTWIGDLILAGSALSYGLFTVLLGLWRVAPISAIAAVNVLSALVWLPCYGLVTGFRPLMAAPVGEVLGQAVYQGILGGGLAVFLYVRGVGVLGASRSGLFPVLVPVFGAVLAAAILREPLSAVQGAGITLVVIGMLISARAHRNARHVHAAEQGEMPVAPGPASRWPSAAK